MLLPFRYSGESLRLEFAALVEHLTPGGGLRLDLYEAAAGVETGFTGDRPAALLSLWLQQVGEGATEREGWSLEWRTSTRAAPPARADRLEVGFEEHAAAGPFEVSGTLELGSSTSSFRSGGAQVPLPLGLERGRYRLELVPEAAAGHVFELSSSPGARADLTTRGIRAEKAWLYPRIGSLQLRRLELSVGGAADLRREELEERTIEGLAAFDELGHRYLLGEAPEPPLPLVSSRRFIRGYSLFLGALLGVRAGEGSDRFHQTFTALLPSGSSPQPPRLFESEFALLSRAEAQAFAKAYVGFSLLGPDADSLLKAARAHHPLEPSRALGTREGEEGSVRARPNPLLAICCLLRAEALGAQVDPQLMGAAWLGVGNLAEASRILTPLAESGDHFALRCVGFMACLRRDYPLALRCWRRLLRLDPRALNREPWRGLYLRAQRSDRG